MGAVEKGLAGCMLGSINLKKLKDILNIETEFKILLVIALGEPKEEVVIETVGHDNNIRYWRDDKEIHHVPKRKLSDVIVASY